MPEKENRPKAFPDQAPGYEYHVWQAMIGPGIEPLGEIKIPQQVYQKQIAATIANLLGKKFVSNHKVAAGISLQTKDAITYKKTEARPEPKVSVDK